MGAEVLFYFDFHSPYSYIAATRIDGLVENRGGRVSWRPISLDHCFKATGQAVLDNPRKMSYIARDAPRLARQLGIPFRWAEVFPMNGKIARRAFYSLDREDPALAKRFALAVFGGFFGKGQDMSSLDQIMTMAEPLGLTRDRLLVASEDAASKVREVRELETAMEDHGLFGVPYMIVGDDHFWGCDRLDLVEKAVARAG